MSCHGGHGDHGFVGARGHQLFLDGSPFYFIGTNCYYMLARAADETCKKDVIAVLDAAVASSMTVIRTWAFNDGKEQWNALQPACGEYSEKVLRGLDWLLLECRRRSLRLLLALTNFWPDYGGMPQYLRWCEPEAAAAEVPAERFYSSSRCQEAFRRFMRAVVLRVNSVTGIPYKDDPTILGWELANEPRCRGSSQGTALKDWISSTAAYLHSLDGNHLIGFGSEGFFGASTPDLQPHNPYPGADLEGTDFLSHHQDPNIHFASFHAYPNHWGHGCSNALHAAAAPTAPPSGSSQASGGAASSGRQVAGLRSRPFLKRWIQAHAQVSRDVLHKPLLLSEFGVYRCTCSPAAVELDEGALPLDPGLPQPEGEGGLVGSSTPAAAAAACREACFDLVLAEVEDHAAAAGPLAGAAIWMLAAPSYPDYDGFTIYPDARSARVLARAKAAAVQLRGSA